MTTVEKEVKECEEETLQTAFKKLRVDAESSAGPVRVPESLTSRLVSRNSPEGAKSKISSSKENWLGCMRKSARGAARNQRRRRSKSPILHPPKFTYCRKMSPPPSQLKHKTPPEPDETGSAKKDTPFSAACPRVFGAIGYETHLPSTTVPESPLSPRTAPVEEGAFSLGGASVSHEEEVAAKGTSAPADFQTLSKLQEGARCPCGKQGCQCPGWQGVEVYSFTGLRNVISECERKESSRTSSGSTSGASSSPRSCSEQARAYVDDITIEDLSGYMEYYLYIPKKMSHMAEMMYT